MQTSREAESDRRFAAHADKLRNVIQACDDAAALTDNVAQLMSDVLDTCHTVRSTIHGLDSACNRLVGERDEVEAFLAALRRRLVHFDRIDDLSSRLASAAVSRLDPNDLLDAIRELEEALAFLRESTGLADSQTYLSRARQLEARLLAHARFRSQAVLQQVTIFLPSRRSARTWLPTLTWMPLPRLACPPSFGCPPMQHGLEGTAEGALKRLWDVSPAAHVRPLSLSQAALIGSPFVAVLAGSSQCSGRGTVSGGGTWRCSMGAAAGQVPLRGRGAPEGPPYRSRNDAGELDGDRTSAQR